MVSSIEYRDAIVIFTIRLAITFLIMYCSENACNHAINQEIKMRNLLVLLAMLISLNVSATDIVCEKSGRFWYPKNDLAIKIASALNVKTCGGMNFKKVVAAKKWTSNVKASAKKMSVDDLIKSL